MADLMNYKTGVLVRTATPEEAAESAAAAEADGGRGAILVTIEGEPTICYVEAEPKPASKCEGLLVWDLGVEANDDDPSFIGGGDIELDNDVDTVADQCGRVVCKMDRSSFESAYAVKIDGVWRPTLVYAPRSRTVEEVWGANLKEGDQVAFTPDGDLWTVCATGAANVKLELFGGARNPEHHLVLYASAQCLYFRSI